LSRLYSSILKKEEKTGTVETLRKRKWGRKRQSGSPEVEVKDNIVREKKEKEKRTTERMVKMCVRNGEEV
jgi:hypothetical protein